MKRLPAAPLFMARALLPRRASPMLPELALRLAPARAPAAQLAAYRRLAGVAQDDRLPIGWPQVWSFRLLMALLTDRAFPLPIWSALQIRNRVWQHAPLAAQARYALIARTHAMRSFDKGVEVDLHCGARDEEGELRWESVTTFYWRGRLSTAGRPAPAEAASPPVEAPVVAQWDSGDGERWRFAVLTGDYNGIHWSDFYARVLGFARAFHYSPRIVGQCLARLRIDPGATRQELQLWIKGPVYYRSALAMRSAATGGAQLFALHVDGDSRPALVGRWSPALFTPRAIPCA